MFITELESKCLYLTEWCSRTIVPLRLKCCRVYCLSLPRAKRLPQMMIPESPKFFCTVQTVHTFYEKPCKANNCSSVTALNNAAPEALYQCQTFCGQLGYGIWKNLSLSGGQPDILEHKISNHSRVTVQTLWAVFSPHDWSWYETFLLSAEDNWRDSKNTIWYCFCTICTRQQPLLATWLQYWMSSHRFPC